MVDTKNIIIIGKTGSGKSALANILSESDEFKEDNSSLTKIWRAVDKKFKVEEIEYRVIDTVGLGNAKLTEEELLTKFEEEVGSYIYEGISQIFLVIGEKLDREVLTEFLWLNEFLFAKKAFDYTTIIRTNFTDFRSKEKREKDTKELVNFFGEREDYEEINAKVLEKEKIVYVNNAPISFNDRSNHEEEINQNKKLRRKSRKTLLDYLNTFNIEETYKPTIRKWLDEKYPENERKEKTVLDISKQVLKEALRLKGFTKLEWLNCSYNQLTNLDLSDCPNLLELNCSNNEFINLNFLKSVGNLEQLDISNCPFQGSLQPLKSLTKLETLFITNTNFSEGLEYLPENCKKLVCNSNSPYKSTKIKEELDKSKCSKEDLYNKRYYDLDQWRATDKANNLTASVIPSERLFVIRSNIKQFLKKWGATDKNGASELSKLQNPKEINTYWYVGEGGQWIARGTAVTGGILAATVNPILGGVLAAVSPVVEIGVSQMKERLYESKQSKWEQFLADADNFLDNFNELLGTLKRIEGGELGQVNIKLKELNQKVCSFLTDYDKDGNWEIDIDELLNERIKFDQELGKLEEIEGAIKELEKEVIKYKKGSSSKEKAEKKESKTENQPVENKLTQIKEKVEQIKKERKKLEQKKNQLEIQLKKEKNDYRQIKKELTEKQSDLLLLKNRQQLTSEESVELENEIKGLKTRLVAAEQSRNDTERQLFQAKIVLINYQIKNLNLGQKVSQGWAATCECARDCIFRTKLYLTTPVHYWEAICCERSSKELNVTENTNQKGKGKEVENSLKDEQQYEARMEVNPQTKS